jgi:hypothetical protein
MSEEKSPLREFFKFGLKDLQIILGTLVVVAAAAALFFNLDKNYARKWDLEWGYWFNLVEFLVILVGLGLCAKTLYRQFITHLPPVHSLLGILAVMVFFGVFTSSQIERQHRVLSDENSWESMALQMYYHQRGGVCNQGYFENGHKNMVCTDEVNNFKGKATSFVEYIAYHFGTIGRDAALPLNFWFYILSIFLLFYALWIALRDEWPALIAAILFASMPLMMMQAQTATTEVLYVFLLSLLMVLFQLFEKSGFHWKHFVLIIPLMGFFAQTRQETLFCFIPFVLFAHQWFRAANWRLPAFSGLLILASWPSINTMAAYRGYDFQGGKHDPHSMANFFHNVSTNVKIMLNFESETNGLLKYPFNTSITILLLAALLWFLIRLIFSPKYRFGALLITLFHLQSFVILVNVSGTFDIDINQRYLLIALPSFALMGGLFVTDISSLALGQIKRFKLNSGLIGLGLISGLTIFLTLYHTESFNKNIMYFKNKLLAEEALLNTKLKEYPAGSVYIYARPWQMLSSGFNGFSERTLLGWSPEKFSEWQVKTSNNIYLVRGQDGYGTVNKDSRVVGFKTTDQIEQIMNKFELERLYMNSKDFGYPLTIHRVVGIKGRNPYTAKIAVTASQNILNGSDSAVFEIRKQFAEPLKVIVKAGQNTIQDSEISDSILTLALTGQKLAPGLHHITFDFILPDQSEYRVKKDLFVQKENAALLSSLPIHSFEQEWGQPQLNKSVEQNDLTLDGEVHAFGIGGHAQGLLRFRIEGAYTEFSSVVGIDDESACGDGVVFKIIGDGKELARSQTLHSHEKAPLTANLAGIRELELVSDRQQDNFCDHANWASAWLK